MTGTPNRLVHVSVLKRKGPVSQNCLRREFVVQNSQRSVFALHLRTLYDEKFLYLKLFIYSFLNVRSVFFWPPSSDFDRQYKSKNLKSLKYGGWGLCHFVFLRRKDATQKDKKMPSEKTKRRKNAMR